jgi:hypothetical protein
LEFGFDEEARGGLEWGEVHEWWVWWVVGWGAGDMEDFSGKRDEVAEAEGVCIELCDGGEQTGA